MAQSAQRAGFWRSARRLAARTPLRVKLISAVLALVAVALAVISVAGIGFLRNSLLGQQDNLLNATISSPQTQTYSRNYLVNLVAGVPQRKQPIVGASVDWVSEGHIYHLAQPVASGYLQHSPTEPGPSYSAHAPWLHSGAPVTVGATNGNGRWRVEAISFPMPTPHGVAYGTLVVGIDVSSVYQTIAKLTGIDIAVSVVLLIALFVIGVGLVRSSLRPLTEIEHTAGAIAAGDLTKRVPERDPRTEMGRLGRSLNAMLTQIEASFYAQAASEESARRSERKIRQFVADASHELRTPLTTIRGHAEFYRQRRKVGTKGNGAGQLEPAELDRMMRRIEQESSRMGVLVEDMLTLARLDQQRPLNLKTVDLLTLAADAVQDARVVAPDRNINLTVGSGGAMLVQGDETRLRQVIGNLMSNAITHTPDGTPIDVLIRTGRLGEATRQAPGQTAAPVPDQSALNQPDPQSDAGQPAEADRPAAVLEVTDHGPGLTKDQAEHAFERFYRANDARTPGGTGLGLAIVAALVGKHGGRAWVTSQPGDGATFCIALPLTPEAAQADDAEDETGLDGEPEELHDVPERSGS